MSSLVEYLNDPGFVAVRLAKATGIAPSVLSKIRNGRMNATLEVTLRCWLATDGAFSLEESMPDKAELFAALRRKIIHGRDIVSYAALNNEPIPQGMNT